MNCWSWPSWQCAAGSPWGHMGQVCKLDAVLLLSWQGSFFFLFLLPSNLRNREATSPTSYLWAQQGPTSAKTRERAKMAELPVKQSPGCHHFTFPPPFSPFFGSYKHTHTHTRSVITLPRLPQCLFHYWLQCFSGGTSAICTALRAASHPASH